MACGTATRAHATTAGISNCWRFHRTSFGHAGMFRHRPTERHCLLVRNF